MLSTAEIEAFYSKVPPALLDIVFELRNLIAATCPNLSEIFQWKGLSYYDASRGGSISAGICQIFVAPDHVQLAFIHGSFLPDPFRLLTGPARYKRFVRLSSYDSVPWAALEALIRASTHFDPRTQSFNL